MEFRFVQATHPFVEPSFAGAIHLIATEGEPRHALLSSSFDIGEKLPGALDYRLELLTDTGNVDEPFGALMLVAFDVPPERAAEVADWYDNEHISLLMRADGWLRARRFNVLNHIGKRWTSLAFHELRDAKVMESEERKIARSTPWRAKLEQETWFRAAGRWTYRPD
jgi:hypothetical protein